MTYLNHAGTSWPKPGPVQEATTAALRTSPDTWAESFARGHRRVASVFGITDPDRLLLTPGCTSALNLGITDHAWSAGDRVLISGLEHHALQRPVTQLTERGVEVTVVGRAAQDPLDLEALERELARGGVRLVAMTAACNVTGELLPVDDIVRCAHAHDALCLIDGAQVAGWLPIDVAASGVDLFTFAGHKALQAPWGIGGLYVAPGVSLASPAATCEMPAPGEAPTCAPMPGYCDAGSVDRLALAGLVAALDWLDEPAQQDRLARARRQVEVMAQTLEARSGVQFHGLRDSQRRLPTLAFRLGDRTSTEVAAALAEHGIQVGSGLQCAPLAHSTLGTESGGLVRLSVGPATRDEEISETLNLLARLI